MAALEVSLPVYMSNLCDVIPGRRLHYNRSLRVHMEIVFGFVGRLHRKKVSGLVGSSC